ncbi:hypothetical protein AUEXF2481DRAFT_340145 [Aureobasidium subglaciale EXF-2481]|uniref:Uncharacterized protein n=1 Tax=Aureobasidium subglaciale (strain EXF-2481) TaxID=1043005 RepID=A0A074YGZ9_AURSE|nr:uncharacterized protein AUEXF2481DRAFT_340145 [Aureobasidium subglaciale EXF-2481]KEQ93372.1 hypothetical protein AUEXF2481DRAFT_340145 [Aureobasidium subglaciale EXF-2481]
MTCCHPNHEKKENQKEQMQARPVSRAWNLRYKEQRQNLHTSLGNCNEILRVFFVFSEEPVCSVRQMSDQTCRPLTSRVGMMSYLPYKARSGNDDHFVTGKPTILHDPHPPLLLVGYLNGSKTRFNVYCGSRIKSRKQLKHCFKGVQAPRENA